jgi:hypothetical protein
LIGSNNPFVFLYCAVNDFNNAQIMLWSKSKHEYCKYWTGYYGTYKSPEELRGDYCDESVDTHSLGNGIFGLLTGLFPFYEYRNRTIVNEMIQKGIFTTIDPRYRTRSFIESRLVIIMEQTWAAQSHDRPTIFEVLEYLRETKRLYEVNMTTKNVRTHLRRPNRTVQTANLI